MKVLISGFETFNDHEENSSEVMAKSLAQEGFHSIILPVEYERSFQILNEEIKRLNPDYVVCLGLAGKRENIEVEKVAINFSHATIPDNRGVLKLNSTIKVAGPAAYFSTLPIEKWLELKTDFPVTQSFTAGAYVCNDLFYRLMDEVKDKKIKAGFIHLPHLKSNKSEIFSTIKNLLLFLNNV